MSRAWGLFLAVAAKSSLSEPLGRYSNTMPSGSACVARKDVVTFANAGLPPALRHTTTPCMYLRHDADEADNVVVADARLPELLQQLRLCEELPGLQMTAWQQQRENERGVHSRFPVVVRGVLRP